MFIQSIYQLNLQLPTASPFILSPCWSCRGKALAWCIFTHKAGFCGQPGDRYMSVRTGTAPALRQWKLKPLLITAQECLCFQWSRGLCPQNIFCIDLMHMCGVYVYRWTDTHIDFSAIISGIWIDIYQNNRLCTTSNLAHSPPLHPKSMH